MWKAVQCAVQGTSHIKSGIPCQDKTYSLTNNGTTVIALADGAGSAKLSHFGADYITRFICRFFAESFDSLYDNQNGQAVKKFIDTEIKKQLTDLSVDMNCNLRDLASTILSVAINDGRFILLHIGDGVIGYSKNSELKIASHPTNGEFSNTTVFTTSFDALTNMKLIKGPIADIDGFILMSDGAETGLYHKREKRLSDVLGRIIQMTAYTPISLIESKLEDSFSQVLRSITTDDCSIAMLSNADNSFKGYLLLDFNTKMELLHINPSGTAVRRRIKRFDEILESLTQPKTLSALSGEIHLKPKYTKERLQHLLKLKLIEQSGEVYSTCIKIKE